MESAQQKMDAPLSFFDQRRLSRAEERAGRWPSMKPLLLQQEWVAMEQVGVEKTEVVVRAVEGAAKALGVAAETAARAEAVRAEVVRAEVVRAEVVRAAGVEVVVEMVVVEMVVAAGVVK